MDLQTIPGPADDMFVDDIFDGWLSVPSMANFLENVPQSSISTKSPEKQPAREQTPLSVDRVATQSYDASNFSNQRAVDAFGLTPTSDETPTPESNPNPRKRRGHTKSRLGCISCKRRKVKCQETWPSCANCMKRGSPCRYPTVFKYAQYDKVASEVLSAPRQFVRLSDTPNTYSANDMRLFHHFLVAAYPCIPHEYESVWVKDIPLFSHQYDYLMHAMLAMSGSHLSIFVDGTSPNIALSHRQKAITGLEEAFTRWPPKAEEAHAMLASSFLLAFQSSYMPDGFMDHILSLRGCALISQLILSHCLQGSFSVDPNLYSGSIALKLRNFPGLDQELGHEALQSLAGFAHLLDEYDAHDIERALVTQLAETIRPLLAPSSQTSVSAGPATPDLTDSATETSSTSESSTPFTLPSPNTFIKNPLFPSDLTPSYSSHDLSTIATLPPDHAVSPIRSFNALMSSLLILSTWPQDAILHLFAPSNKLGAIILVHFCAVRFVVSPFSAPQSAMRTPVGAMIEWCEKVVDLVEDGEGEWGRYIEWPRKTIRCLKKCVDRKKGLLFGDVYEMLVKDPAAFREGRAGVI